MFGALMAYGSRPTAHGAWLRARLRVFALSVAAGSIVAQGLSPATLEAQAAPAQQTPAQQAPAQQPPPSPTPDPRAPQAPAPTPAPQTVPPATPAVPAKPAPAGTGAPAPAAVTVPGDYIIGPDDILSVVVWREKELSADVVVRPDGRITLPLVNDVVAAGLTPEMLRARITDAVSKFVEEPAVTVVVKQINSRRVFVTGMVGRPGPYPLSSETTILQLLSTAGGVSEFADSKKIIIMRKEGGRLVALKFNYKDVIRGKNLQQNILLKPGDTVVVP